MRAKKNTSILLLGAFIFLFSACEFEKIEIFKKHPDDDYPTDILPLATEFGADRLGCLINGEIFANTKQNNGYGEPVSARYESFPPNSFYIYGRAKDKSYIYLLMHPDSIREKDTISLVLARYNTLLLEDASYPRFIDTENAKIYFTRFDTINKIISGRFEFTAHSADVNDNSYGDSIIHITDGRFDIRIK